MTKQEMINKYIEKGGEREVYHGEYLGILCGLQDCNDGYFCGLYHFAGGICCSGKLIKL